jgi:ATP-dependent Clp protease ATP-binding subunit ClpA
MRGKQSESLYLVWRIAELEARQLKATNIAPHHLLLALSKCVDLDLTALVPKDTPKRDDILEQLLREVRRIRTIFRVADFDAKTFRRRLRKLSPEVRFDQNDPDPLHRSPETKKLFAEAQHFAELSDQVVYPVHLLLAVLCTTEASSDDVMRQLGIDKKRLEKITKREVFSARPANFSLGDENKRGRN